MKYFLKYINDKGENVNLQCESWEQANTFFDIAKRETYDEDYGISIVTDQGITKKSTKYLVSDCFYATGEYKNGFDPSKGPQNIEQLKIFKSLWDENGNPKLNKKDVETFLKIYEVKALTDLAKYYWSMIYKPVSSVEKVEIE